MYVAAADLEASAKETPPQPEEGKDEPKKTPEKIATVTEVSQEIEKKQVRPPRLCLLISGATFKFFREHNSCVRGSEVTDGYNYLVFW